MSEPADPPIGPLADDDLLILRPPGRLAYRHRHDAVLARPMTALEVVNAMTARPMPVVALAFRLRDALVRPFGLAPMGGFSGTRFEAAAPGDRLDFLTVVDARPDRLTLALRDRHLVALICVRVAGHDLTVLTSVAASNLLGRLYMIPVAPAHGIILRRMLRPPLSRPA